MVMELTVVKEISCSFGSLLWLWKLTIVMEG